MEATLQLGQTAKMKIQYIHLTEEVNCFPAMIPKTTQVLTLSNISHSFSVLTILIIDLISVRIKPCSIKLLMLQRLLSHYLQQRENLLPRPKSSASQSTLISRVLPRVNHSLWRMYHPTLEEGVVEPGPNIPWGLRGVANCKRLDRLFRILLTIEEKPKKSKSLEEFLRTGSLMKKTPCH